MQFRASPAPTARLAENSATAQIVAFATGVPPYIYAFHRYTWNSTILYCTLAARFPRLTEAKLRYFLHHVCLIQVTIALRFHLFPFRTEKLSSVTPMVLRNSGRVGSRRFFRERSPCIGRCRGFLVLGLSFRTGMLCIRLFAPFICLFSGFTLYFFFPCYLIVIFTEQNW